jgi:hypothetical protein
MTPVMQPEQKSVNNAPAANTTATIGSEVPNQTSDRIMVTSLAAFLSVLATPPAAPVQMVLRDGAAGVGTILWTGQLMAGVNGSDKLIATGLQIPMTPGNIATWESTGAGGATTQLSVSMTYFRTGATG